MACKAKVTGCRTPQFVPFFAVWMCYWISACCGLSPNGQGVNLGTSLCSCRTARTVHSVGEANQCPQGFRFQSNQLGQRPVSFPAASQLAGCCVPLNCPSTPSDVASWQQDQSHQHYPPQDHKPLNLQQQATLQRLQEQAQVVSTDPLSAATSAPPSDWMSQCCSDMLLRQMFLPGTHDSGTYQFTTPKHMPMVIDEVMTILFNIVGDLSRTQQLDVYQQLQAGARVLDVRLAINPWIAVHARAQRWAQGSLYSIPSVSTRVAGDSSSSSSSIASGSSKGWASQLATGLATRMQRLRGRFAGHSTQHLPQQQGATTHPDGLQTPAPTQLFQLDGLRLQGQLDLMQLGGPLTASERRSSIVTSHSLPCAPLVAVLSDLRRFLAENPGELVVLLVKADTIDVNVAGSLRFTDEDWAAAADVFEEQLQGVQLVDEQQVQLLTLGQLAAGSRGGGSVLLYSSELQRLGVTAVNSRRARILESWGNGTNTEDLNDLKHRLVNWLTFWRSSNWRQNRKPFLLLASAEVTLGVKTILTMVRNRVWRWQTTATGEAVAATHRAIEQLQLLLSAQEVQTFGSRIRQAFGRRLQQQQQQQHQAGGQFDMLASGLNTLYQLGVETNKQMMAEVLGDSKVPKDFNVWSLDAISPEIASYVISLNAGVQPSSQD